MRVGSLWEQPQVDIRGTAVRGIFGFGLVFKL